MAQIAPIASVPFRWHRLSLAETDASDHVSAACYRLAESTDRERAGVTHATAQQMLVRGLIDRDPGPARFKLATLLKADT